MPSLTKLARATLEAVRYAGKPGADKARRAALRDATRNGQRFDDARHLDETLAWICRAHDATGRRGVSRSYSLREHRRYRCVGWLPAYPETTGYIVPTLYEAARALRRPELAERATEMATWEVEIQMDSGAVRGGTVADEPASPAAFNTGQVLLGWTRAAEETGDPTFDAAAARAAAWLVGCQDQDGAWRSGASSFAGSGDHVYNARAAWGLGRWGKHSGDEAALAGARRAAELALHHQHGNGWFAENCLSHNDQPLTHTIAYAAQGVLEIGVLLGDRRFVDAAHETARGVVGAVRSDGLLPGRLDREYRPAVGWSCLTGAAQMVLVWDRLTALDGGSEYSATADHVLHRLLSLQDLESSDPGIRGGVAGSYPIWGGYGTYECLNWAAKFTADALLGRLTGNRGGSWG